MRTRHFHDLGGRFALSVRQFASLLDMTDDGESTRHEQQHRPKPRTPLTIPPLPSPLLTTLNTTTNNNKNAGYHGAQTHATSSTGCSTLIRTC